MEAKPAFSDSGHPAHDDFLTYPLHKVVSVFDSSDDVDAALSELQADGFSLDDIEAFCGMEGEKRLDFDGEGHGYLTKLVRSAQHIGPDRTYLERYERHLRDGHCMILVKVRKKDDKDRAARILGSHTSEQVTYFGLLSAAEVR